MKLRDVHVRLYRNIVDSTPVSIDDHVTCLVGKNESGKTAFLQALYSLNPDQASLVEVDLTQDYPRWRKVRDSRDQDLLAVPLVDARFELEATDIDAVRAGSGIRIPRGASMTASRNYGGGLTLNLAISDAACIDEALNWPELSKETRELIAGVRTITELKAGVAAAARRVDKRTKEAKRVAALRTYVNTVEEAGSGKLQEGLLRLLEAQMPKVFYFSDVSILEGRLDLTGILAKRPHELKRRPEHTALALLKLANVTGTEFTQADFEERIAELEAAASEISRQVFKYWTTNTDIVVKFLGDSEVVPTGQGQQVVHRYLDIRLEDLRHDMSTNFSTRSTGFQWFFSFIAAFSEFERQERVIILLDEPALGLHARAQGDLLRYIEERLALTGQVIYTTHSPFMVNPKHPERARLVEDLSSREEPDLGAKISADVLAAKGDTLFPLQAALGYDLAQNLFVGPYNLVVEGPSDLVYLTVLSEHLLDMGRVSLDQRFSIVPVGGAEKIPTFVALLGAHLPDVTVLVDGLGREHQRLMDMIDRSLLKKQHLVGIGEFAPVVSSNVEDLFTAAEYLSLYNQAFSATLSAKSLPGSDSIIRRIERALGRKFDHLRPAALMLTRRGSFLKRLSQGTVARFEALLQRLNETING